jgi:internalin A
MTRPICAKPEISMPPLRQLTVVLLASAWLVASSAEAQKSAPPANGAENVPTTPAKPPALSNESLGRLLRALYDKELIPWQDEGPPKDYALALKYTPPKSKENLHWTVSCEVVERGELCPVVRVWFNCQLLPDDVDAGRLRAMLDWSGGHGVSRAFFKTAHRKDGTMLSLVVEAPPEDATEERFPKVIDGLLLMAYDTSYLWGGKLSEPLPKAAAKPDGEGAAVKTLEKLGGRVTHADNDPAKPVIKVRFYGTGVTDAGLKALAGLKGLQELQELQELSVDDSRVTDAGLKELAGLKGLQTLSLSENDQVTDAGLKELAGLQELQTLRLWQAKVTDAGLKELAGLKGLRNLDLGYCAVTDAGLKDLTGLTKLRTLNLLGTRVTDAGLKDLTGRLTALEELDLTGTNVTSAGLKPLADLTGLKTLQLERTSVTDAGLKNLAGLKGLQNLGLNGTQVTDAGLKNLADLKELQTLDLSNTKVTGAGLKDLAGLNGLHTLALMLTPVTEAGLKEAAGLKGLKNLNLMVTGVTDSDLKVLASAKGLQSLSLGKTGVTNAAVAELQKALPDCKIGR